MDFANILLIIFLIILFLLLLILALLIFMPFLFWGAIYLPTKQAILKKMIELADIKPGEKAVDLGAGDGRLVIALAKAGAEAHGYEINPFLVWFAKQNIRKVGLKGKAFIHWRSFWRKDLSDFDVITIFGISHIMKRLESKFKKELKNNARVVSNAFNLPNWPIAKKESGVYLYKN